MRSSDGLTQCARVGETVESLIRNNGPTPSGEALGGQRLCLAELKEALEIARAMGLSPAWKPHHFMNVWGKLHDPEIVETMVLEKIRSLRDQKFGGSLFRVATAGSTIDFISDYTTRVEGRDIRIPFGSVAELFHLSPHEIFSAYLAYTSQEERERFSGIKPWTMKATPRNIFADQDQRLGLIAEKIDSLLKESYGNEFYALAHAASEVELRTPLISELDGNAVRVPVQEALRYWRCSPYPMLQDYVRFKQKQKALPESVSLPPYIRKKMPQRYANDRSVHMEIFVLLVRAQIKLTGSKKEAFASFSRDVLEGGFLWSGSEYPIRVSTKNAVRALGIHTKNAVDFYEAHKHKIKPHRWDIKTVTSTQAQ